MSWGLGQPLGCIPYVRALEFMPGECSASANQPWGLLAPTGDGLEPVTGGVAVVLKRRPVKPLVSKIFCKI
jgi:hypothetical protein